MSKFAERLDDVMEEGDTLIIERSYDDKGEQFLSIKFVTVDTDFGILKQVEFIDAKSATPGKLIRTIESVKGRIVDAIETIQQAQSPETPAEE